jgi:hypothetical protein
MKINKDWEPSIITCKKYEKNPVYHWLGHGT